MSRPAHPEPQPTELLPRLPPKLHPSVRDLLADPALLTGLTDRFGSPLNLLLPDVVTENVAAFRTVLDAADVRYRIFYAAKANPAAALAAAAGRAGTGIDVASPGELRRAVRLGFSPDRIEVTGPKGRRFLAEAVARGACVNADNPWELSELVSAGRTAGTAPIDVLVRFSGFGGFSGTAAGDRRVSRFGTSVDRAAEVLDVLRTATDAVRFRGVSFHLDTGEPAERVRAVQDCLAVLELAWRGGLRPTVLDIGGGFRQAFVDDPRHADAYVARLKAGLTGRGRPMTWGGVTLGYRIEAGSVAGTPVFHKYLGSTPGHRTLEALLDAPMPDHGGRRVAQVLADNLLELWLEPGKALVDHAGLTVATVEFVTSPVDGEHLVALDLSRDKVCPADQEVFLDPVVIPRPGRAVDPSGGPVGVFFAGNLCLERDLVLQHRVFLDALPQPGDLVVFVNTAAYQMDLSASEALLRPRPTKIALRSDANGSWHAAPDDAVPDDAAPDDAAAGLLERSGP